MSSSKTICIHDLDAADYELARRWQCDNILLENSDSIDTYTQKRSIFS